MEVRTLDSTPGFVVYDAPDAPTSVGPTRLGAKLIPGNAVMYARSMTYAFAALGYQRAGATIGLRSDPDGAEAAVAALATELEGDLASQRLLTSPGLRLDAEALAPVLQHDQRSPMRLDDRDGVPFEAELVALGAATGAQRALGGLDGRTVAIEGFGPTGIAVAREVEAAGGSVGRVATASGTVSGTFTASQLSESWAAHGDGLVGELGDPAKPWAVFSGDGVDVVFIGSAPGRLSGEGAATLGDTPVVPFGPAVVSSKALADLRKRSVPVMPDFVTTAGAVLGWWPDDGADHDTVRGAVVETVGGLIDEASAHADGPYLGACYRAEEFMRSWMDELPFGRPLG